MITPLLMICLKTILTWRDVPVDLDNVGVSAKVTMPTIKQVFIAKNENEANFEKRLYIIRKVIENKVNTFCAPPTVYRFLIKEDLSQFDFSEIAIRVASKLLRKYQGKLPSKALKDKLTQSLINKGFSFQESKLAIDHLELEADEENEQALLYKEIDKQYQKFSKKYDGYELKQHLTQSLFRKGYDFDAIASALREYL